MKARGANVACPCGGGDKYKRCCRPLHRGAPAQTPERLMRSRYAAYAFGVVDYILDTTHPAGPHFRLDREAWSQEVFEFCRSTRFVGLEVLEVGLDVGGDPFVTFHAKLKQGRQDASFVERSLFRVCDGRWTYLDGAPIETR